MLAEVVRNLPPFLMRKELGPLPLSKPSLESVVSAVLRMKVFLHLITRAFWAKVFHPGVSILLRPHIFCATQLNMGWDWSEFSNPKHKKCHFLFSFSPPPLPLQLVFYCWLALLPERILEKSLPPSKETPLSSCLPHLKVKILTKYMCRTRKSHSK